MKRYLLFSGEAYYRCGGWDDFQGDFDSIEEAEKQASEVDSDNEWLQIIDTTSKLKVRDK